MSALQVCCHILIAPNVDALFAGPITSPPSTACFAAGGCDGGSGWGEATQLQETSFHFQDWKPHLMPRLGGSFLQKGADWKLQFQTPVWNTSRKCPKACKERRGNHAGIAVWSVRTVQVLGDHFQCRLCLLLVQLQPGAWHSCLIYVNLVSSFLTVISASSMLLSSHSN